LEIFDAQDEIPRIADARPGSVAGEYDRLIARRRRKCPDVIQRAAADRDRLVDRRGVDLQQGGLFMLGGKLGAQSHALRLG
jgi:hypothetical protein